MIVVGLTGGIGAGKTTVANFFRELNVPVYIADVQAKILMETSEEIKSLILAEFGSQAYHHTQPDTKYLAKIVFADEAKLEKLNQIIHPRVALHFEKWKNVQKAKYVVYETAILFEKGNHKNCDYSILVTAPVEERMRRVMHRDNASYEEVMARMQKQWTDEEKRKLASFVIENEKLENVRREVLKIHEHLLRLG